MLYLYTGTDREKARAALNTAVQKESGHATITRISDANTLADLEASLQGEGMFGDAQIVVFDGVLNNADMRVRIMSSLPILGKAKEPFFILEEKLDADTRKRVEKYAERSERYDAAAKKRDSSVFDLGHALARGDKRALWLALQKEFVKGTAPEALHGVLFWGAKDFFMKSRPGEAKERARRLVVALAELPHEARRRGEELENALERFALSGL